MKSFYMKNIADLTDFIREFHNYTEFVRRQQDDSDLAAKIEKLRQDVGTQFRQSLGSAREASRPHKRRRKESSEGNPGHQEDSGHGPSTRACLVQSLAQAGYGTLDINEPGWELIDQVCLRSCFMLRHQADSCVA